MHDAAFATPSPQMSRRIRYFVLGAASLLALAMALALQIPAAGAQAAGAQAAGAAPAAVASEGQAAQKHPVPAAPEVATGEKDDFSAKIDIRKDKSGKRVITIEKAGTLPDEAGEAQAGPADGPPPVTSSRKHGGRARVQIEGADPDIDSFEQFLEKQPAFATMVVGIVALVFLSPVLAIGLVLWYRFRKTRMMNEAMLKLAEKGVVPPAQALDALASGTPAEALTTATAGTPLQEQARQIRRRTAWSDLRRGVILGGLGLAFTVYSAWDDGRPNIAGLVLLFLGIGYAVLWWFEERQLKPATGPGPGSVGGPPTL